MISDSAEPSGHEARDAATEWLVDRLAGCTGPERVRLERLLIRIQTHLARDIARCYARLGHQPGQALRVAMSGLMYAVRTFDPDGRTDFRTYATSVIQLELSKEIAAHRPGETALTAGMSATGLTQVAVLSSPPDSGLGSAPSAGAH